MNIDFWDKHLHNKCVLPTLHHTAFTGLHADTTYFASSIQERIRQTMKSQSVASFQYDGCHVTFTFVHGRTPKYVQTFYLWFFVKILQGLGILAPLKRDMNLVLIDTPVKKQYTKNTKVLTNHEVNSGVTIKYLQDNTCYVYIYRREEMSKVLIHELIHALEIDKVTLDPVKEERLRSFFGVTNDTLHVNETFTDTLACYVHTMVYTILERMVSGTALSRKHWRNNLQMETKYVLGQARRLLDFYGHFDDKARWFPHQRFHEHTHTVAYYILKGAAFSQLERWETYMRKHDWKLRDEQWFIDLLESSVFRQSSKFWKEMHVVAYDPSFSLRMTTLDIAKLVYRAKDKLLKSLSTG